MSDEKEICPRCYSRGVSTGPLGRSICPDCFGSGTRPEGVRESLERSNCPACINKTLHSVADWKYHPMAGHGFTKEQGYSHPLLEPPGQIVDKPKDALLQEYLDRKSTIQ